ncbi:ABC transporter ATP-binding protein [Brevibacillus sp. B_LB10_24]|uniref:ABC transporter ATP-binding protein n=1 Tax=Brevibacillus sp. B_LB10_24 TaxID=3380645 RepID=UPI0038B946A7
MEAVLQVRELTKQYKNGRGVKQVSFDVRRGEIFGLFGPNGAGKTTVLKIITGLCAADEGSVTLFGCRIDEHFEKAMKRVGCIIETAEAYEYLSACDNLKLAARFYPELPKTRIEEALEWVGLRPYRHEKVGRYSLGMKQRLALARALLIEPELVILDEPTNGLDIEGMVDVRNLILRLSREQGTTFLISSHMIHEMEQICTRIGILYEGKLIRQGEVPKVLDGQPTLEQAYMSAIQTAKETGAHA